MSLPAYSSCFYLSVLKPRLLKRQALLQTICFSAKHESDTLSIKSSYPVLPLSRYFLSLLLHCQQLPLLRMRATGQAEKMADDVKSQLHRPNWDLDTDSTDLYDRM